MTNPNDSAFAHWSPTGQQAGLTKREYFAALAMQGLLAMDDDYHRNADLKAVEWADLLIAALNEEVQNDD